MSKPSASPGRSPTIKTGQRLEVTVERLAAGGSGIVKHDGMVGFVPLSAPGDLLEITVTTVKKNFFEAEIAKILNPGPGRRLPPCPYYEKCGGCNWQHLEYDIQLEQKQNLLDVALARRGLPISTQPILPSPTEWNYRNRVQMRAHQQSLGFFQRGSHHVINIENCLITDPRLNAILPDLRQKFLPSNKLKKFELTLLTDGETHLSEEAAHGEVLGFSQVNEFQNQQMLAQVCKTIAHIQPDEIWDLYAGQGNLTFPLARQFPEIPITGVELNSNAVKKALKIARHEKFLAEDVGKFLAAQNQIGRPELPRETNHLVVLDPPRAGCEASVMASLKKLRPKWILFISCNPPLMVRDLAEEFPQGTAPLSQLYEIKAIQGFDMFPQTDHLEAMAFLERRD